MTQYVALTLGRVPDARRARRRASKIDPIAALSRALGPKYPAPVRIAAAASLAKHAARLDGKLDDPRAVDGPRRGRRATTTPSSGRCAVYALGFFGGDGGRRGPPRAAQRRGPVRPLQRRRRARPSGRSCGALGTFREMLSPADLEQGIAIESPAERQNKIEAIELEALARLQTSVNDAKPALAQALRPEVEAAGPVGTRRRTEQCPGRF